MRSACWLFTPLAMDPAAMQQAFTTTLDWLIDNPKSASLNEIENRRERIRNFLHYLSHQASPQELESYGIKLRPFQLSPED
jgi:hypothetical protein